MFNREVRASLTKQQIYKGQIRRETQCGTQRGGLSHQPLSGCRILWRQHWGYRGNIWQNSQGRRTTAFELLCGLPATVCRCPTFRPTDSTAKFSVQPL